MVTASHNPKIDNGYKVYGDNGAQIIPPVDEHISECIMANLNQWEGVDQLLDANTGLLKDTSKIVDLYDESVGSYMTEIPKDLARKPEATAKSNLKIVYTAMHGVGYPFVSQIVEKFGFKNLIVVPQQRDPDPEFSTVSFPNPEEKGALDLAMALADKEGSPMVIANDPDADRFAAAEKTKDGKWHIFHGDELGILFGAYQFQAFKEKGLPASSMLFICSAVSSRMLKKLAETEGCRFEDTMTGFKWMANKSMEVRNKEQFEHLLAYEEALGYQLSEKVADKDGVSASGVWVEMACELYAQGKTVHDKLDELRKKYGYFVTNNAYFLCYDPPTFKAIFDEFRNNGQYKWQLGKFKVTAIRDVTVGYDSTKPDKKCTFPLTATSQMVTLTFENGATLTARTSGTEPKLKWYSEMSSSDPAKARVELQEVVDAVIKDIFQPEKYGLKKP